MAVDIEKIFGLASGKEDERVQLAVLLRFLAQLLDKDRDDELLDEREQNAREIPVRPRVEPLGGA
jgi:hypothetical protein